MSGKTKIGEIFSDYQTKSNIMYATVTALNVIKKTNTLEVSIYFDEYIEIKEIWFFEKFLRERFQFKSVDIKIKYHEGVEKKGIKEEWKNIIAYMAHKYPLARPMLLLKSDIEVNGTDILIKMHIKGADFLKAKKADKELTKLLENIFGVTYKIEIVEEITKEDMNAIKERLKAEENKIVAHIEEENKKYLEEVAVPEYSDPDYKMPEDMEGYIPEEEMMQGEQQENINIEYIMGKPSKAKEKHVTIKDLSADSGRVTLEGRVIDSNVRETKSGKGMLIFEI